MKKLIVVSSLLVSAALFAADTGNVPADSVDVAKLAIVQKSPTRVFIDFGNEVAVRSLSWKGAAQPKVYAKWWKKLGDEDPKTRKLYMHVLFWQFGEMPIDFADKVAYAQLLNDKSEVEIKWGRLYPPVEKPPVEIPVIEFTMK